jgi:CRISPR-associated Csx2 family protein
MTHTLIGFLGKAQKKDGQYREACYNFEGRKETSRFFTGALNKVISPERLIILGTSGSMWDVLCENIGGDGHDQWAKLSEAVESDQVTQDQLDQFNIHFSHVLNVDCRLKIIPYGDNLAEQIEILQIMAADVRQGDKVSLDLTHGLRHLPMLGLLSAMYLQTAREVAIEGLYYGALDRTKDGITPVMRLDGLLTLAEWINALQGFDKTGDIAPFSGLLQAQGMEQKTAEHLEEAAFLESILDIPKARSPLRKFADQTKAGLPGIGALFADSLQKRIAWHKGSDLYSRQRSNAFFYLEQSDYLRAAALGYESFITLHVKQDKTVPALDQEDYDDRERVKKNIENNKDPAYWKDYKLLRNLRNSLVHANRDNTKETQRALSSKQHLSAELRRLFDVLLPLS